MPIRTLLAASEDALSLQAVPVVERVALLTVVTRIIKRLSASITCLDFRHREFLSLANYTVRSSRTLDLGLHLSHRYVKRIRWKIRDDIGQFLERVFGLLKFLVEIRLT